MPYVFVQAKKEGDVITGVFVDEDTNKPELVNGTLMQTTDVKLLAKGNFKIITGEAAQQFIESLTPLDVRSREVIRRELREEILSKYWGDNDVYIYRNKRNGKFFVTTLYREGKRLDPQVYEMIDSESYESPYEFGISNEDVIDQALKRIDEKLSKQK